MPKESQMHTGPRQRPVSCRFCRSRKLRCSREAPCSNCVSRGIECELEAPNGQSPGARTSSESELLERIRRLEERLEQQKSQQHQRVRPSPDGFDIPTQQAHSLDVPPQMEQLDSDVAFLESIYNGLDRSGTMPSYRVVFKICPIQQIMDAPQYMNQNGSSYSTHPGPSRCVWLPQYSEAKILLDKFVQDIEHIHHIIAPKLLSILDEVYSRLNQQGHVRSGEMILLLSIFASATYVWMHHDCCERGLFSTPGEANRQAPMWIKATEDVLDIAHRTTRVSIEGIQGIIIASFISGNLDGFLRRCKSLYNTALMLARELSLHCIDHPSNAHLANSAQAEIGRRVWWYLVASDWALAARFSGISRGVYQCHPRHMMTNKPLNLDDEDLVDGMTRIGRPINQPTAMSYSLQRIRLAEISRNIVDRTPLIMANTGGLSYDAVMDIDTELQLLLNNLPPFFSMSVLDLIETYRVDPSRAASIIRQGHMFHSLFYAQRCKLHLPFVSRGFLDPEYAPSREICIQSACLIIQTESKLESSGLFVAGRYKYLGLLVSVTMASIVLLIDLCHNKSSPHHESHRGELAQAFRMLEDAKNESPTAARFLDSLVHVFRKHKISPPKPAAQPHLVPHIPTASPLSAPHDSGSHLYSVSTSAPIPTVLSDMLAGNRGSTTGKTNEGVSNEEDWSYMNDFVQGIEQGTLDNFDWDSVFLGLNTSFM